MAVPKFITNDMKGGYVGGPATPARRCYVGGGLVYQGFSPATEQEFISKTAQHSGPAQLLKVYGKTIVNNQVIDPAKIPSTKVVKGITMTKDGDTIFASGTTTESWWANYNISFEPTIGHKYLLYCFPNGGLGRGVYAHPQSIGGTNPDDYGDGTVFTISGNTTYIAINFNGSESNPITVDNFIICPRLFDLTLRFGAGNEPTSVDEALRLLGGDAFNPTYDPGSLQSNKTAELRAERIPVINVWDEDWELGGYAFSTGAKATQSDRIRNLNGIAVSPATTYFVKGPARIAVLYYAQDGTYLGYDDNKQNQVFTTPANCVSVNFFCVVTTYNHDICINLSDPAINGQYYSHWRGSLQLNLSTLTGKLNGEGASVVVYPDGLRGVGTNRDEAYGSTGVVRLGKRAYQAGDESDTSVLTDGTNTIYPLATPLTYTLDTPMPTDLTCVQGDILQRVSDNNCPFVGEMRFGL